MILSGTDSIIRENHSSTLGCSLIRERVIDSDSFCDLDVYVNVASRLLLLGNVMRASHRCLNNQIKLK